MILQGLREKESFSPAKIPRVSILSWNPGPRRGKPGAIEKHTAGKWHFIALQEAIEYLQHECLMNHFYITHFAGCAVLLNKDTCHSDVQVNSDYIQDTRDGQQQVVKEGQSGWVLQAVTSRATFRRILRNGESFFTMMSLHINNQCAKRRGIEKKTVTCSPFCNASRWCRMATPIR